LIGPAVGSDEVIYHPLAGAADNRSIRSCAPMIEVTRLNGNSMVLNSDLIKTAEASPDTMLTLITGEKLIVREECSEVVERVLAYRARLLAAVSRRLGSLGDLQTVVSLASLDPSGQPGPTPLPPKRVPAQQI
jgi:flagellar protein FlbD